MQNDAKKKQKIRIRLRSFDNRLVDQAAADIVDAVKRSGTPTAGPVPLPTRKEIFTVNRSPHKDKKSMEQFQLETHNRMIDIFEPNANTMDALRKINLPSGVEISIAL
jgi:small subunit ribosomal protein S10